MTFWPSILRVLSVSATLGVVVGCATTKVTKLPEGGFRITCEGGLNECALRAEKICGNKGVTIVAGRSKVEVLGGSSSSYQTAAQTGFIEGMCGEPPRAKEADENAVYQVGGVEPLTGATPEATPAASAGAPARACVPGASQKCFGAGACEGGQACLADGSGYGPCQCAAPPAPVATPAAPPATEK